MILFTGLTGTSGRCLVDILIRENYTEKFRVVARQTTKLEQLKNSGLNYEVVYGSIDDEDFMSRAADGCDTVFHIAAKAKLGVVANAIAKTSTVKHAIFVSSTSIFSKYREASSKIISAETRMKSLFSERGISWTLIRPTMIFGSLNDNNISTFMRWLDRYPLFPIVKNGKALLQPVNKRDIAEAYYLIMANPEITKGKEYVVSGEKPMTLRDTLSQISTSIGKKTKFINIPMWLGTCGANVLFYVSLKKVDIREKLFRLGEDRAFDHTIITDELGYNPKPFSYWIELLAGEYLEGKVK